jgi:hypothetical protein
LPIETPPVLDHKNTHASKKRRAADIISFIEEPIVETASYKSYYTTSVTKLIDTFIKEIDRRFLEKGIAPLVCIYQNIVDNKELDETLDVEKELATHRPLLSKNGTRSDQARRKEDGNQTLTSIGIQTEIVDST